MTWFKCHMVLCFKYLIIPQPVVFNLLQQQHVLIRYRWMLSARKNFWKQSPASVCVSRCTKRSSLILCLAFTCSITQNHLMNIKVRRRCCNLSVLSNVCLNLAIQFWFNINYNDIELLFVLNLWACLGYRLCKIIIY